jgi:hypothetical protein
MKAAIRATLTLVAILGFCWIFLRLSVPYLSYERLSWLVAGFFLVAGVVVILRSQRNSADSAQVPNDRRKGTIEGCFYLAIAILIAVVSSLMFKRG